MKKLKLLKPAAQPVLKVSKTIPVEDKNGNKHILKATVISVSDETVKKNRTNAIEDFMTDSAFNGKIIRPPLNQLELTMLQEYSSELGQIIDTMAVGIEGFGGRLIQRKCADEAKEQHKAAISEEKNWLTSFFELPNHEGSFLKMRKETREDLEATGNAYWELVPSPVKKERYSAMNKMDVATMYISKADKKFTPARMKYVDADMQIHAKTFLVRFRRFVQVVHNKKVWFKEFGDPRTIDKRTGDVIANPETVNKKFYANEIFHHKIYTPKRTPYGMPRFAGNIIAVKGSRSADETNILTQQNNHVPSMAILVSGGMLTDGSIARIREFIDTQIKGSSNYSKFLILEGEGQHDGLSNASSMKIEIKPLSDAQHKDQLWQEYDKNNASKLRRSFRMAPIMIGSSENYDRATAQTGEAMTEKYVFNPERQAMDESINRIMLQQGFRFWCFKSNTPNVTNDEDLVAIITGGEKTGAVTPRIGRDMLQDILGRELPEFEEDKNAPGYFNPDVPFSLTLAQQMAGVGAANFNGTFAPQGQTPTADGQPGRPPEDGSAPVPTGDGIAPDSVKQVALNGAQVTALLDIVNKVSLQQVPFESAMETVMLAFALSREQAEKILKPAQGFKPKEDPNAQPPGRFGGGAEAGGKPAVDNTEKLHNDADPHLILEKVLANPNKLLGNLVKLRDALEDDLDKKSFGKPKRDYFKHAK